MDVLRFFIFRTAFPFGYLLFVGLPLLGAIGLGVTLLMRDVRKLPRSGAMQLSWGLVILAGVALYLGLTEVYARALDLNPVVNERDLVGLWRDGAATLELQADGTYRCGKSREACGAFSQMGRWVHDGSFQLSFTPAGGSERSTLVRRIVRYAGTLRLTSAFEDPDEWDGALSFAHSAPAS
jgi:hypothetical protein